jgi:hypothetical protein
MSFSKNGMGQSLGVIQPDPTPPAPKPEPAPQPDDQKAK